MEFKDIISFIVAVAIGGLVGLEREIYQQKKKRGFAGIRTYLVVALLGAICSYISQSPIARENGWTVLTYLVLSGIILLISFSYYVSAKRGYMGLTTELSVILIFVLSSAAMIPKYQNLAVILAVILAILLSAKDLLHGFARRTKKVEWFDTLKFVFMVFVILPLLPNRDLTILGIEDAFNPYNTWMMVVFVSGVSFVGYVLTKVVGGSQGIGLSGVLGGIVSSTAVTQSTAQDSKKNPKLVHAYAFAAIAATVVKLFRVIFEVVVVEFNLISLNALPLLVMSLMGILVLARWVDKAEQANKEEVEFGTPLSIKPALIFGVLYSFVGFITRVFMKLDLGSVSYLFMGAVSGIADVDALTLSMAELFEDGGVSMELAWRTIMAAVLSNIVFKTVVAGTSGSKKYFRRVGAALLLMAVMGVIFMFVRF